MSVDSWRLIVDPPADGAWNMAVDEAIFEAYERAEVKPAPTLRVYGWQPAAVSLGKSQSATGVPEPHVLAQDGIDLVRRPTGGIAVLHEIERTYAVVGALGREPFGTGVVRTYRAIAQALTRGLSTLGVAANAQEPRSASSQGAACFERIGAWELVAAGRKLVGSAQARRRGAFLQHGSIPIRLDPSRLAAVLRVPIDGARFIDLERAAGAPVTSDALDSALVVGFEAAFDVSLRPGALTESESLRAAELRCWKYDSMSWTREGVIGAREARWGPAVAR